MSISPLFPFDFQTKTNAFLLAATLQLGYGIFNLATTSTQGLQKGRKNCEFCDTFLFIGKSCLFAKTQELYI